MCFIGSSKFGACMYQLTVPNLGSMTLFSVSWIQRNLAHFVISVVTLITFLYLAIIKFNDPSTNI